MKIAIRHSLKTRVSLALLVQFAVLAASVMVTLYQLEQRKHDYVILNLSGQLRVISEVMVKQSVNYKMHAPRDYATYNRDLGLYKKDLYGLIADYDRIIDSFQRRELSPDLTGKAEIITCSWDQQSRSQLDVSGLVWENFRDGLYKQLGTDREAPRLEYAAQYVIDKQAELQNASADLAVAFRAMMEEKLRQISLLNKLTLLVSTLIALTLLLLLWRKVYRPLDDMVRAFGRVARGDMSVRIPTAGGDELTHLSDSFNSLTERLASMFRLTDRIHQAASLDETLEFVSEEFSGFLPLDWVGWMRACPRGERLILERVFSHLDGGAAGSNGREEFNMLPALAEAGSGDSLLLNYDELATVQEDEFAAALAARGLGSALVLRLSSRAHDVGYLIFAARGAGVYRESHREFLSNIAWQVGNSFDKTLGLESLVVSAVAGLAKLAESRDPETGDHLLRMSLYAAILAEELGREGPYREHITPAYVRDVHRFAPMHDIGKVGIADDILLKPGRLTDAEREEMQKHPDIGADVLRRCEQQMREVGQSIFQIGIEIAEGHHERYDGKGYPQGHSAHAIPLSARIVAVADVFDALTSKRPYKEAWSIDRALEVMREERGGHFDPAIIDALNRAMPRIVGIYEEHKHV